MEITSVIGQKGEFNGVREERWQQWYALNSTANVDDICGSPCRCRTGNSTARDGQRNDYRLERRHCVAEWRTFFLY